MLLHSCIHFACIHTVIPSCHGPHSIAIAVAAHYDCCKLLLLLLPLLRDWIGLDWIVLVVDWYWSSVCVVEQRDMRVSSPTTRR
jgi:hypothetical protein